MTMFLAILFTFVAAANPGKQESQDQESKAEFVSRVGYPNVIRGFLISGDLLLARPIEERSQPIILRILETYQHGEGHRYDLEYIGLDPGTHDLADYLQRADGLPVQELPEITVKIESRLPPGQVEPNEIIQRSTWFSSVYLAILLVGGVIWLLGLFAILFVGRHRVRRPTGDEKIVTVADRLKPLIENAVAGEISVSEKAELERVLVAFWRKKLKLAHLPADRLRGKLREHPQASMLLTQIDNWLHRPDPDQNVDIADLLTPYQTLKLEEI